MKRFLVLFLAVFMVVGMASVASAAPVTYFDFDGDKLADTSLLVENVGEAFTADIYIADVDDTYGGLLSMGLEVSYDSSQVNVTSIVHDLSWFIPMKDLPRWDNETGLAEMGGGRLDGLEGALLLGTITFECIDEGVSELLMAELYPDLSTFDSFVATDGHVYDSEIGYGSADVSQVPIPGAALLLGSGLLGLVGIKRRFHF
ncbi:MAG: hypothetical protein LWX52_11335 [Deltaproteobacteria bacterium]|jgi:hypothetical protein|nr:hypothetical protein [Deltaproteobacteria bacterium]